MIMVTSMVSLLMFCLIIGLESPQFLIMCLLIQTIVVVILMGLASKLWYAYVLFLVFFGGMLILFVYVSSLASSMKLDYNSGSNFFILIFSSMIVMLSLISKPVFILIVEDMNFSESNMVSILLSDLSWLLYLYVVSYLLVALYNVCWMVKVFEGPLRVFV
uniref:NADH dehydrogenase subunit 6 n=1 Tax=Armadillidium album TaxID=96802 RepID=A0A1P8DKJ3_9CRUS|nr:NADH dehydrogenase subunit 6 [Armadillidium album]